MTKRDTAILLGVICAAAAVGLYIGWKQFRFLTDDAFIAFRYAANSILGYGYTWNPPPFKPVEGYTSFLWVILVEYIWRIFGIIPPRSANYISLLFSYMTLLLTALMVWKMKLSERLNSFRIVLLALILTGILLNRTFLTWSSSGLETAMFNFFLLAWIYLAVFGKNYDDRWRMLLTGVTSLVYLSRPDGILVVFGTLIILSGALWVDIKRRRLNMWWLLSVSPLVMAPIHFVWRRLFYGEWLPNTYYAKHVCAWPESGLRYLASFMLEYALWVWLLLHVAAVIYLVARRKRRESSARKERGDSNILYWDRGSFNTAVAVLLVVLHIAYYTLIIGGDHFEYRVYSYLVPIIFISFLWMINRLKLKPAAAMVLFAVFILLSQPVPWTHRALTRKLYSREQTHMMQVAIAERFPAPLRWYGEMFDNLQFWLIRHHVCSRYQEHKVFYEYLMRWYPTREEGGRIGPEGYPVMAKGSVGIPGWVFPHVAIIDRMGLNDYVIARYDYMAREERLMAHDRVPPPGYIESFMPNVVVAEMQTITMAPRPQPLTAGAIMKCEAYWIDKIIKEKEIGR